jgi:hypothetical protein
VSTYVTVFQAGVATTETWKVTNPLSNGYNIIEFLVNAGGAGVAPAFTGCSAATGTWTITNPTNQEEDFVWTGGIPLTPGSTDTFMCTFTSVAQSGANAADTYTWTYLTQDSTHSGDVTAGTATIYIAAPDATFATFGSTDSETPSGQPVDTTLVAGTTVQVNFRLESAGTPGKGVAGIPVVFTWTSADGTYNNSGLATLTASGVTSASGKVNATFFLDPVIADQAVGAIVHVFAGSTHQANANLMQASETFLVTIAAAPVAIGVKIAGGDLNQAQDSIPIPSSAITASVTDTYGNPVPAPSAISVTLAVVNVIGTSAAFSTSVAYPPASPSITAAMTIPMSASSAHPGTNLFFGTEYGDQSYITASASGYATTSSKTVMTWGFNFLGAADIVYLHNAAPKEVVAGGTTTVQVKFTIPQANVPVNFFILKPAAAGYACAPTCTSPHYNGYFDANPKFNNITVLTSATGIAAADLKVSTVALAWATVGISYPGNYPQAFFDGGKAETGTITSEAGTAVALTFIASYDNHCTVEDPCNFISIVSNPGFAVNGTTMWFDIQSVDNYSNPAVISTLSNTQVSVTPTTGLSATTLFIVKGDTAVSGNAFGPVAWSLPATIGTALTLTATATGLTSATLSITTVSAMPWIKVTSPTLTNGVMYSKFSAVTFRGLANVSKGFATKGPNKVTIVKVGYKLNSNPWKSSSIAVPAPQVSWSFAVALNAGLNTIQFNATDSKGDVNTTAVYQVLVDSAAPKMGFTTANNAVINAGTPVTAWAYDLEGDFNASSVVVKANSVALPAADVVVTGTNNLGHNSSFTIAITLTAGTWTLTLSASDYAGNAGAAASSIKVTVNVPQDETFTSAGAAQCTVNGAFTGDCITFTNNAATAQTATFLFVWYNVAGQVVAITGSSATVAAGGQYQASSAFSAAGSYTVQAFVISANNSALSVQYAATITIP